MIAISHFCLLLVIINGLSSVFAAEWSEWMDLTPCSSKPCECDDNPNYTTRCHSNGMKAQIRRCIRKEGELDGCMGGGHFRYVSGCDNRHICPGWSEWSEWSECDCYTNQRNKERRCNNPSPIHPDVLCLKYNTEAGTEETFSKHCHCSDDKYTTTLPTSTDGWPPVTTELPWCCEMYKEKDANDYNAYGYDYDEAQIYADDETVPYREARHADDNYYSFYDGICIECSEYNGYSGKHGNREYDIRGPFFD